MNPALVAKHSQLIDAPMGKLEVDALWQQNNPLANNVERVALLCHPNPLAEGTMMNKIVTTMYRFARDSGFHVVRFNFRGVGRSTGSYGNTEGEIDDAIAVLQWIQEQTNARQLWIGGFSFGGYIAGKLAQRIIEQGAFLGLEDFDITDIALIAPSIEKHNIQDLILPAEKTFSIFGDKDELISPCSLQRFAEKMAIRYAIVPDTGHFFHGKLGELTTLLQQFTTK